MILTRNASHGWINFEGPQRDSPPPPFGRFLRGCRPPRCRCLTPGSIAARVSNSLTIRSVSSTRRSVSSRTRRSASKTAIHSPAATTAPAPSSISSPKTTAHLDRRVSHAHVLHRLLRTGRLKDEDTFLPNPPPIGILQSKIALPKQGRADADMGRALLNGDLEVGTHPH